MTSPNIRTNLIQLYDKSCHSHDLTFNDRDNLPGIPGDVLFCMGCASMIFILWTFLAVFWKTRGRLHSSTWQIIAILMSLCSYIEFKVMITHEVLCDQEKEVAHWMSFLLSISGFGPETVGGLLMASRYWQFTLAEMSLLWWSISLIVENSRLTGQFFNFDQTLFFKSSLAAYLLVATCFWIVVPAFILWYDLRQDPLSFLINASSVENMLFGYFVTPTLILLGVLQWYSFSYLFLRRHAHISKSYELSEHVNHQHFLTLSIIFFSMPKCLFLFMAFDFYAGWRDSINTDYWKQEARLHALLTVYEMAQAFGLSYALLRSPLVRVSFSEFIVAPLCCYKEQAKKTGYWRQRLFQEFVDRQLINRGSQFVCSSQSNMIASQISQGLVQSMRRDIQEGTQIPANPDREVRSFREKTSMSCLKKEVFEEGTFISHLAYQDLLNFETKQSYFTSHSLRRMLIHERTESRDSNMKTYANLFLRSMVRPENQRIVRSDSEVKIKAFCPSIARHLSELCYVDQAEIIQSLTNETAFQKCFLCPDLIEQLNRYSLLEAALSKKKKWKLAEVAKLRAAILGKADDVMKASCLDFEFMTDDRKFIVKIISKSQRQVLLKNLRSLYDHVKNGKRLCFIQKVLGVFKMSGGPVLGQSKVNVAIFLNTERVVKMQNCLALTTSITKWPFQDCKHRATSLRARSAISPTSEVDITKLVFRNQDFFALLESSKFSKVINLREADRRMVLKVLTRDLAFLAAKNLKGYAVKLSVQYNSSKELQHTLMSQGLASEEDVLDKLMKNYSKQGTSGTLQDNSFMTHPNLSAYDQEAVSKTETGMSRATYLGFNPTNLQGWLATQSSRRAKALPMIPNQLYDRASRFGPGGGGDDSYKNNSRLMSTVISADCSLSSVIASMQKRENMSKNAKQALTLGQVGSQCGRFVYHISIVDFSEERLLPGGLASAEELLSCVKNYLISAL